jgi:hypothetical protein
VGGRRGREEVQDDLSEPQRLVAVGEVPGGGEQFEAASGAGVVRAGGVFGGDAEILPPGDQQQGRAADPAEPLETVQALSALSGSKSRLPPLICGLGYAFVLVEQATQDWSALDPSVGKVRGGMIRVGWEELKCSMGSSPVVLADDHPDAARRRGGRCPRRSPSGARRSRGNGRRGMRTDTF